MPGVGPVAAPRWQRLRMLPRRLANYVRELFRAFDHFLRLRRLLLVHLGRPQPLLARSAGCLPQSIPFSPSRPAAAPRASTARKMPWQPTAPFPTSARTPSSAQTVNHQPTAPAIIRSESNAPAQKFP